MIYRPYTNNNAVPGNTLGPIQDQPFPSTSLLGAFVSRLPYAYSIIDSIIDRNPKFKEFSYSNEVFRILEDPRVTKPYTEDQWQTINALGAAVDKELLEQDVRLTTGGEPTFVSIDDMESEQWNTGALGADKLRLAKDLLLRMRNTFAPNGLLHYGQGKWYPGEEVPRWALGCFWRTDGQALWTNPNLLARADKNYGLTHVDAKKFAQLLCEKIRVNSDHLIPAYEDVLYYLWAEQNLPPDINPLKADLKDDLERRRIAKL
jgi:uncharacterized protein (DUF2126 family)